MSNIMRNSPTLELGSCVMCDDPDGMWVTYPSHQEALAAAKAEIERLNNARVATQNNAAVAAERWAHLDKTNQDEIGKLQARVEELEQPVGELIAAWVDEFGEIGVDDSADRLDRAMAAVAAAFGHSSANRGTENTENDGTS